MRHFQLIQKSVPVAGILRELEENPELWDQHRARKDAPGTPHGGMSDIWVRYNDAAPYEAGKRPWSLFNDAHIPIWYPAWEKLQSLHEPVFDLMAAVQGEMLGGVLITKIPPGQEIKKHTDDGWHVQYYEKFYLSVQSAPGAQFGCQVEGEPWEILEPHAGEVWLFDNRKPHWVENRSTKDRITVIICIRTAMFGRK